MALKNPLLWTYIVVDILVLLSGLGILAVVLITQMSMNKMDTSNVAQNILLMNCPLTGAPISLPISPACFSSFDRRDRRRHSDLRYVPGFGSGPHLPDQPYLAEDPWMAPCGHRPVHPRPWLGYLV